jgi:spoIIIJ-associated protein
MYDVRNEPREFAAATREEALVKATAHFGLAADALRVVELEAGDVAGAGSRVVLVAIPRDAQVRRPPQREERDRGGREPRRGEERKERWRGGRERREPEGRPREERRPQPEAAPAPPPEPSVGTRRGELGEIGEFVLGALERMELGPFEISESTEDEIVVVQLTGRGAQAAAGSESRALEALQLLANQTALRRAGENPRRVIIEVEGEREDREAFLGEIAVRAARRAQSSGRSVALEPMNGKDRRAIHVALRDMPGIATMSIGSGRYRQVVVVPEGAPEYEEARRHETGLTQEG